MRGPERLLCDATDPREGRGYGKPCPRKVVVESRRTMPDPASSYTMHYCKRHAHRAGEKPACALSVENRRIS